MRRFVFAFVALVALSACTTLENKSFQKIHIDTPGVAGADCTLETENNKYKIISPGSTLVERSPDRMIVSCQKAGYVTGVVTLHSKLRVGNTFWNTLNGVIPGTAYDVYSGSIYDYEDNIVMNLQIDPNASTVPMEDPVAPPPQRRAAPEPAPVTPSPEADRGFSGSLRK